MEPGANRVLCAQCGAYLLALVCALCVVVPMAQNGSHFKERCLLFAEGSWHMENASGALVSRFTVDRWGPPSACQFSAFVGIFTLLFAAIQSWRSCFYLFRGHDDTLFSAFLTLLLCVSVFFLALVGSVMVSIGFSVWCETVTDDGGLSMSCEEAQSTLLHLDVNASLFYIQFGIAQFALWCISALWLILAVLAFVKVYRNHQRKELSRCLAREKELLLGRSGHRDSACPQESAPSVFL